MATNESGVIGELVTEESALEYARKLVAGGAPKPATPSAASILAERDELIAEMARLRSECADRKRELQPALDQAIRDAEAIEEPKKRRERLANEMQAVVGGLLEMEGRTRRAIEAAAPKIIGQTVDELKAALAATSPRDTARRQRREKAINQVEALVFVPGDPRPAIERILSELTKGDLE